MTTSSDDKTLSFWNRSFESKGFLLLLLLACWSGEGLTVFAQNVPKAGAAAPDDTDAPVRTSQAASSAAVDIDTAWSLLTSATTNAKHPDLRIQGLAALGPIGTNARAGKLIIDAMSDPDLDVRTAAILAAGQSQSHAFIPHLARLLDDHEPQVAVAAASTLWKMGDHGGEDILMAVADGERKATAGLMDSTRHTVTSDLHNPAAVARVGALQGATMLLGPFGFGITAYEYIHKNGGDSARPLAIELLSQEQTKPIHDELISALGDKDVGVRAAAAKALGGYHDRATAVAIANLFYDAKPPVRLTAAAAYLRSTGAVGPARTVTRPAKQK